MTKFIDKKKLSEQDISTKLIVPAIQRSGWDVMLQVSEQKFITDGRIILSGKSIAKYSGQARKVLDALLDKYANQGVANIEDINILTVNPFSSIGSPIEIIQEFGGRDAYFLAVSELEREIYSQIFV